MLIVEIPGTSIEVCTFLVFLLMIAMHVIEDFHLQGRMADMKQKSWWEEYPLQYRGDYVPVLMLHGMEWSILVSLPLLLITGLNVPGIVLLGIVINGFVHAIVDDLKANRFLINLETDQSIHILQILLIYLLAVWTVTYGAMA